MTCQGASGRGREVDEGAARTSSSGATVEEKKVLGNHLENYFHLANKKALYYNLKSYYESVGEDVFQVLPLTFHIKEGVSDPEFVRFQEFYA